MAVTFVLQAGERTSPLPAGAQVVTVPALGIALVRVGSQVLAWGPGGIVGGYTPAQLVALWREWVL